MARLRAQAIQHEPDGMSFDVVEGDMRHRLSTRLVGQYNVSNLLGVIAALRSLGLPLLKVVAACSDLSPVPGRMDTLAAADQPLVVIDYAHTPDALDKVLHALKPVASSRAGKLWCVFGCGGDRDAGKRPLMASIAENAADRVVVTSDNPRGEDAMSIIRQILQGIRHPEAIEVREDRALAIAYAVTSASADDVVLIAGKGHEDYQEIRGVKTPFSDRQQAELAMRQIPARSVGGGRS
jgi:UDP-N-acetylmuramoyl-L-alanyl-D-glutamate--2,6-diaminopimelate ligase